MYFNRYAFTVCVKAFVQFVPAFKHFKGFCRYHKIISHKSFWEVVSTPPGSFCLESQIRNEYSVSGNSLRTFAMSSVQFMPEDVVMTALRNG